ncbi:T9SS type A sorting domain-containing protein [Flexithrix dorotheae]|uniref:T9SS type A sorting domain-containing protein n=1 Tax=Flexithrix dorotheae TaxID=70993 RepID=UPI00035EFD02|nr:T9SS type A sorting domain-containing protein [Flexithrix dorotheae]
MKHNYFKNNACYLLVIMIFLAFSTKAQIENIPGKSSSKVSSTLLNLQTSANLRKGITTTDIGGFKALDLSYTIGNDVVIEAVADDGNGSKLLAELKKIGLKRGSAYGRMVSGLFPINKIGELEKVNSMKFARPAYKPSTNKGSTTSQGDVSLHSDVARSNFGTSGKGLKIGVLSDSYNNLGGEALGISTGDLPAGGVEVLLDLPPDENGVLTGSDEGRAMLEIIHDVAPGADLAFHTAFLGQAEFANGIVALQEAGCDIIVDDIAYFAEPFFSNGVIAQAANYVNRKGSIYLSSAGNGNRESYQSGFNNSGIEPLGPGNGFAHDFGGGDIFQSVTIGPGSSFVFSLQWDDPFFSASGIGADTDLDVFILFGSTIISAGVNINIDGDPVEIVGVTNGGATAASVDVLIVKYEGPDPNLIKWVNYGDTPDLIEYDTKSSTCVGHSNTYGAIAVGASAWFNTPEWNSNVTEPIINSFSSAGGTPLLFRDNGKPLRRPVVLRKPDITGPDGGNTTFFGNDLPFNPPFAGEPDGFPNFFGTSASAPHVAAVVSMMQEASGKDLKLFKIRRIFQKTSVDMDDPFTEGKFDKRFDFGTGYGFVQADKAVELVIKESRPRHAVRPVLEKVVADGSGKYKAIFGYKNENKSFVIIPIGRNNRFYPVKDEGQVSAFKPGRQYAQFEVPLNPGETIVWTLKGPDGKRRTSTATAPGKPAARIAASILEPSNEENQLTQDLAIYPNPTSGLVNFNAIAEIGQVIELSVVNTLGQRILELNSVSQLETSFDFAQQGKGLYIAQFRIGEKILLKKFVVE